MYVYLKCVCILKSDKQSVSYLKKITSGCVSERVCVYFSYDKQSVFFLKKEGMCVRECSVYVYVSKTSNVKFLYKKRDSFV